MLVISKLDVMPLAKQLVVESMGGEGGEGA